MNKFKPTIYVQDVTQIDYKQLEENGIKLICFDLDNTLDVPDQITTELVPACETALRMISQTKMQVFITSNNSIPNRVKSFSDIIGVDYIANMKKPFQHKYKSSTVLSRYRPREIVFIGDKLVTDVLGGNRFGSYTVLVDPLVSTKKHWYTVFMTVADGVYQAVIGFNRGNYYNNLGEK